MKILIVDDSIVMRTFLTHVLRSPHAELREAADGMEALEILGEGFSPDLVMLDVNMPGINGLQVLELMRKRPEWHAIKVMMVTSEVDQGMVGSALELGATEYLMKPFTKESILQKMSLLGLNIKTFA